MDKDDPIEVEEFDEIETEDQTMKSAYVANITNWLAAQDKKKLLIGTAIAVAVIVILLVAVIVGSAYFLFGSSSNEVSDYEDASLSIIDATTENAGAIYTDLADFTDLYPARICG
jgi:flagellar basal body-associated protein FliL